MSEPPAEAEQVEPTARGTSRVAIASFVLGLLSLGCCCFTGAPAIILGAIRLTQIKRAPQQPAPGKNLAIAGIALGSFGVGLTLIALPVAALILMPAIQAGREAAQQITSMSNLREIGQAILAESASKGRLPAAATEDEAGNPLLSWRVNILPGLGKPELAKAFKQDEPWNGPVNQLLLADEPPVYVAPGDKRHIQGETSVVAVVGADTLLTPEGIMSDDAPDGAANTILAVELADTGIAWSEPRDLSIDEFVDAAQRGDEEHGPRPVYSRGVVCLFGDGSTRLVPRDTPAETLRALCTRNGGEAAQPPE
jgi:hypothetical protein